MPGWRSVACFSVPSFGTSTWSQKGTRRTSAPRVRRTKPSASPSAASAATARVTPSVVPAAAAGAESERVTPRSVVCGVTDAAQGAAPPPASVSASSVEVVVPRRTSPNESAVGSVKTSASSACGRSMRPPPSRSGESSVPEPAGCTGAPVDSSADLTCAGVHAGCRSFRSAAAAATCGAAMLVPLQSWFDHWLCGSDESRSTPGAVTSGLSWSESGVGPLDEKSAITSAGPLSPSVDAATVIALGAVPGEPIEPRPVSLKSLPAATAVITPASAALSIAFTTMSRDGSISGSPRERLMTSMPSFTASSIPRRSRGSCRRGRTPSVGVVSTL